MDQPQSASSAEDKFERARVPKKALLSGSYFAASYSGEHVAGGEFVVGAAFAAWGASPATVIGGLILGNLLAVLSWALVCSPVAVRARLTLYYYIEKLAGRHFLFFFGIVNGLIFAVIAGGMITISASAVRGLVGGENQIHWYPTSGLFVLFALMVGVFTVLITIRGFERLARFSKLCAPWLLTIFVVSGLASLPFLMHEARASGLSFTEMFSHFVWTGRTPDGSEPFSMWQIAAFAWGLNLPLHLGMGDLSTLRFAKRKEYGFYSVFATYGGHFMAWVACSILGATTAAMLGTAVGKLDIGGIVVPVLGITGTAAVMISSLTTAVPSLYRAGLAFQSMCPKISLAKVTVAVGAVTTLVACSPIIFLKWLDLMAYFNIAMAPIGSLIFVEHFILPRMGYSPFWREGQADYNKPAWIVWITGIVVALAVVMSGALHLFFIFVPVWIICTVLYTVLVRAMVKPDASGKTVAEIYSSAYGDDDMSQEEEYKVPPLSGSMFADNLFKIFSAALAGMILLSVAMYFPEDPSTFKKVFQIGLAVFSVVYFVAVVFWRQKRDRLIVSHTE